MIQSTVPLVGHLIDGQMSTADVGDVHDLGRLDDAVARVAVGSEADVDLAVRSAHAAFPGWRDTPAAERVRLLLAAADVVAGNDAELAPLLVRERGVLWEAQTDLGLGTGVLQHTASLVEGCRGTCRSS
jgi:acyl-CoA reductase-like NAD-dependent aldehyde dehydrogenase